MPLELMPQSVRALADGSLGDAQGLTRALRTLRDAESDPGRRQALSDVLSGRTSLRAFLRTPEGSAVLGQGRRSFTQQWTSLDERQRADLAERGRAQEAEWRDEFDALPERARARLRPDG